MLILRLKDTKTELIKRANSTIIAIQLTKKDNLRQRRFLRLKQRPQIQLFVIIQNKAILILYIRLKVNTINYCCSKIVCYSYVINRQRYVLYLNRSAFVIFNYQILGSLKFIIDNKTVLQTWSVICPLVFKDIIWANLCLRTCKQAVQRTTVQVLFILFVLNISLLVSILQIIYLISIVLLLIRINLLPAPLIALLQGIILSVIIVLFVSRIIPSSLCMITQLRHNYSQQD